MQSVRLSSVVVIVGLALLHPLLFTSPASAACSVTNILANGTPADASQVNQNFNDLVSCAAPIAGPTFSGTVTVPSGSVLGTPSSINLSNATALPLSSGVSGVLLGTNGGTSNGFVAFSGPTSSLKTFSLPNASATILTTATAVSFYATLGPSSQSIPSSTVTVIDFNNVVIDTGGYYNAANDRFTPLVAGTYEVCFQGSWISTDSGVQPYTNYVRKSGSNYARWTGFQYNATVGSIATSPTICGVLVAMNGSTDYIDVTGISGAGSLLMQGNADPMTHISIKRIGD